MVKINGINEWIMFVNNNQRQWNEGSSKQWDMQLI